MENIKPNEITAGVVGLGLMGCSITTCLLMAGHKVIAVAPIAVDLLHAERRIREHLVNALNHGLITEMPEHYFQQLVLTEDYALLEPCGLVIECTIEDIAIKNPSTKRLKLL